MTVTLYHLGVCVSGEGGGGASSTFRRRSVWLKCSHSIHIKAKSEKHIHYMTTIFYLYDCIRVSPGVGVAFTLHYGGVFALKGSAPSRVYHLAGA